MKRRTDRRIVIALLILCGGVGYSCLLLMHLPNRTSYQAYLALDRNKEPGQPPSDMTNAVLLYRTGAICYDAFPPGELHDRLLAKNGEAITIEYEAACLEIIGRYLPYGSGCVC